MPMKIDRDQMERLLRANDFSQVEVARFLVVSPQRVFAMCKELGIKVAKTIEYVEPQSRAKNPPPVPEPPKKGKK